MLFVRASSSPVTILVAFFTGVCLLFVSLVVKPVRVDAGAVATGSTAQQVTVFSNTAPINPADRPSNNAGTNPGLPPSNYPSPIVVSGLTGTITKITVTFALTTTFPDDFDILLVGPTGAQSLVMSDAGGSGDITNVSFTFDQAAAAQIIDTQGTPLPPGTFQPSNYAGLATPEPGGQDNFPSAGGLAAYPTGFNIFNGTAPNGTWNLYVVDDQNLDTANALPSGWSIDITTGGGPTTDAPVDFNGDSRTDYAIVRNNGGTPQSSITWWYTFSSGGPLNVTNWGLGTDFFVPEDYDNDNKDDIAIWRPGAPTVAAFYILNSATNTVRVEAFGQTGDIPSIVDDYDNDGAADIAVYRDPAVAGGQSTWYFRTSPGGPVTFINWGLSGDIPAPGDYDGDGRGDFVVQRDNGDGTAKFWRLFSGGGTDTVQFGFPSDFVAPGDYDDDGKTDICVVRVNASDILEWYIEPSGTPGVSAIQVNFGNDVTDFPTQGDYDGDGRTEVSIWRNNGSFWIYNLQTGALSVFNFGVNGDYPVANYNVH